MRPVHNSTVDYAWFKTRKAELGLKDQQIADAAGRERSVVNKVVNGSGAFAADRADELAKLFEVSRTEMLVRMGFLRPEDRADAPIARENDVDMVGIQHIDLAYGLGATFSDGYVDVEVLHFPKLWVETITHSPPALLTWTRGRGDSMEPTIKDGDLVLLDRSQRVIREPDALWAFAVGTTAAIKRLRLKGDRVQVFSDNPSVPPDEEMLADINIVGRVVFVGARK